ncbi:MAG: MgtC/SapB family protein [Caulobacteraceae bacterium]|nr:MgtC/SapB family protein [Caulobacter sp.]
MSLTLSITDIALRIGLTILAAVLFGLDRGLRGHPAGLRTMVLVGLAAALAMISAMALLATEGKTAGSFATMDVMRLPLGILTGVGFIGGGTILRRGGLITGITTAATLWIVTVIGLCFGAGQFGLGLSGTVLGALTIWGLQWVEHRLPREGRGALVIEAATGESAAAITRSLAEDGLEATLLRQAATDDPARQRLTFALRWTRRPGDGPPLEALERIGRRHTIQRFSIPSTMED